MLPEREMCLYPSDDSHTCFLRQLFMNENLETSPLDLMRQDLYGCKKHNPQLPSEPRALHDGAASFQHASMPTHTIHSMTLNHQHQHVSDSMTLILSVQCR